jgi:putative membrane protein
VKPDPYSFTFEPLFIVLVLAAAATYVRAGGARLGWRALAFLVGLALIAVPVNSPVETLAAHYLLLVHLAQNALIADWAPPLLLVGLTAGWRSAIRRRGGRAFAFATWPPVAIVLWLVAWYGVHVPAFYEWSLRERWPLNLEHGILLLAGLVFWWPVFEPEPRRLGAAGILAYLGGAFAASPWLALAFIFSTSPFYDFYLRAPRLWGLSATKDQNLGGILMQSEQTVVFLALLVYAFLKLLGEEEAAQVERESRRCG